MREPCSFSPPMRRRSLNSYKMVSVLSLVEMRAPLLKAFTMRSLPFLADCLIAEGSFAQGYFPSVLSTGRGHSLQAKAAFFSKSTAANPPPTWEKERRWRCLPKTSLFFFRCRRGYRGKPDFSSRGRERFCWTHPPFSPLLKKIATCPPSFPRDRRDRFSPPLREKLKIGCPLPCGKCYYCRPPRFFFKKVGVEAGL